MQITEPQVTLEIAKNLGLTEAEFNKIQEIMGRMPNFTELSILLCNVVGTLLLQKLNYPAENAPIRWRQNAR